MAGQEPPWLFYLSLTPLSSAASLPQYGTG